jgi:hypothetical protein
MSKSGVLGLIAIGGIAFLLLKKGGAAAVSSGTTTLSDAAMAKIMADTQSKLDSAAKLAAANDYAGAAKAAQVAAQEAAATGNIPAASKAAIQAAAYANQAQEVARAKAGLETNIYVPATEATIASGVSTAFEIANSGLGGIADVGQTITVSGIDGEKAFINTGNGYAEYTPVLAAAAANVAVTGAAAVKASIISKGFATSAQLAKMSDAELTVYEAIVLANNPGLVSGKTSAEISIENAASERAALNAANIATQAAATTNQAATQAYQQAVTQFDQSNPYSSAIAIAKTAGVTLNAPADGGTISIVQNLGTGLPSVVDVQVNPQQAAEYNAAINNGYAPFQAAIISGISK